MREVNFTKTPFLVAVRLRVFLLFTYVNYTIITHGIGYKSIESTVYKINRILSIIFLYFTKTFYSFVAQILIKYEERFKRLRRLLRNRVTGEWSINHQLKKETCSFKERIEALESS